MNRQCWHGFCILTGCDGLHHVDATGYSWEQERGTAYCPEHQAYDRCGDGPVFTDYERAARCPFCGFTGTAEQVDAHRAAYVRRGIELDRR